MDGNAAKLTIGHPSGGVLIHLAEFVLARL
jgi:hypothetical protein